MSKTQPPSAAPSQSMPEKSSWLPGLFLLLMVAATYWSVLDAGFIWDDDDYVTENEQLRTLGGLGEIWFDIGATPQYYPLVHTTFWIEYQLWELDPAGYHFDNLALHALGALLLWRVLKQLRVPGAWFAAALFAIHPVEVESVAWVTERKNVLSGFMYLAAALAYFRFTGTDGNAERSWKNYGSALLLFLGALLSKTVTASFPAAILVVFWWKRGSLRRRDLAPLVPFFLLGLVFGLTTAWLEQTHVGAEGADWSLSVVERFLVAGRISLFYVFKILWPDPLIFFYTRWDVSSSAPLQYLFPAAVLAILAACWFARKRIGRGPLAAFLFLGGTLVPALGFVNVYPMRFAYVADHFQYLAGIGVFVLLGAGFARCADRRNTFGLRNAGIALIYIILGAITMRQVSAYHDLETLWLDTLDKNPGAWVAHNNLGIILRERGSLEEAEARYREAIRLLPTFVDARNNLGAVLRQKGETAAAVASFAEAAELDPHKPEINLNLASALLELGRVEEALPPADRNIELSPNHADFRVFRARILQKLLRLEEALRDVDKALELQPRHVQALSSKGQILVMLRKPAAAVTYFERVLELDPNSVEALGGICQPLVQLGERERALGYARRLQQLQPNSTFVVELLKRLGEQ